ncbi:MAG: type VI secretion system baseplate subunit TssE [Acidobacteriia bacterium]|nr:type VI secretion system baseplate subunit TssE [Terriglobia bacterium]
MQPFEARVVPSLLDRLTDYAPASHTENPLNRSQALRALKASLWRDLTTLLNTKRREEELPEGFPETNQSLLTYGLPDFLSYSLRSIYDQQKLRRAIETTIRKFEPRLEKVSVALVNAKGEPRDPSDTDSALHFRVDALLRIDPAPEPVSFETLLQPDIGHFVVLGESR